MTDTSSYEVIIIGGSYAGLSAAMALGRSLRSVLVIDSGLPCNRQTPHSQNFLTQDGKSPKDILMLAKQQVAKYATVTFHNGLAVKATKMESGFEVITAANGKFTAKKLILATGIKDSLPNIPGLAECWGISIIHCPYCHGYEYRKQNTAIMANGAKAFHLASLIHNLTDSISILTTGKADFNPEQKDKLVRHHINIIETKITTLEHTNGQLQNVIFDDNTKISFDAMYVALPFTQHSEIPASLGCELTEHGYLKVDDFQRTNILDVYACGDNANMMRSIANAVYTGNLTGAVVNGALTNEQF